MKNEGITQQNNAFKGFYQGKMQVGRIYHTQPEFNFAQSNILLSFHDLATGEILQTKPMKAYVTENSSTTHRVDVNLFFKSHGYFVLEFHGLGPNDELSFTTSF